MKTIKLFISFTILFIIFVSCSSDDDDIVEVNPVAELNLVTEFKTNGHIIELYSKNNNFTTGYNEVYIRIKDLTSENYFSDAEITWIPMMHMVDREHSCPKSTLTLTENTTVSKGFLIFQMSGNVEEYWDLKLNYKVNGNTFETTHRIEVFLPADGKQKVSVFKGSDDTRYILAMVAPAEPEVKVNDFVATLYKMENMMSFPVVENYKITVDPRMPGMGNHSSPNNKDLTYDAISKMYRGKLSLTMTGYWKINLKLLNDKNEVLKGEDVTDENPESSLYFELEF